MVVERNGVDEIQKNLVGDIIDNDEFQDFIDDVIKD